jgi:hypothetical protein
MDVKRRRLCHEKVSNWHWHSRTGVGRSVLRESSCIMRHALLDAGLHHSLPAACLVNTWRRADDTRSRHHLFQHWINLSGCAMRNRTKGGGHKHCNKQNLSQWHGWCRTAPGPGHGVAVRCGILAIRRTITPRWSLERQIVVHAMRS